MTARVPALILLVLGLAACEARDDSLSRNTTAPVSEESMGENGTMLNDMTTANDVAISNRM
ncbi:hypothetical protein [Sphingomonas lenta]|uniref:Uncharacterized protein n=1 Tax=Sphingomonas lenta TaxID=1141887 RepID=A0A2A2SEF2_9SPHN|nr:hypothetical protein [Sphingomonas lenta]PAX07619.1 hypothetical protein CKY28_08180 [Sphingomonas lenta]